MKPCRKTNWIGRECIKLKTICQSTFTSVTSDELCFSKRNIHVLCFYKKKLLNIP